MSLHQFKLFRFGFIRAGVAASVLTLFSLSAQAEPLKPMKYFQNPVALSAFAIAANVLGECQVPLKFAEQLNKNENEQYLLVSIACEKYPNGDGKTQQASVELVFDTNDKGEIIGAPSLEYKLP